MRVKICGVTNVEDAVTACEAGADALGFIFYPKSARAVTVADASQIIRELPPFVTTVGVFVKPSVDEVERAADLCGLDRVQIHGVDDPGFFRDVGVPAIRAVAVRDRASVEGLERFGVRAVLLDAYDPERPGGTGKTFDWELASALARGAQEMILAGGLTPENVADAIRVVRPYAVDVATGVEREPGRKDFAKVRDFIRAAKEAR
ncbi:MAG: phosphoribosylanthranilate isomerase [Candidatus Methylomirabilis sp.]|nr:phosphoribosylanthranilate isomerase [Deltaproteobacteria bacterium]